MKTTDVFTCQLPAAGSTYSPRLEKNVCGKKSTILLDEKRH